MEREVRIQPGMNRTIGFIGAISLCATLLLGSTAEAASSSAQAGEGNGHHVYMPFVAMDSMRVELPLSFANAWGGTTYGTVSGLNPEDGTMLAYWSPDPLRPELGYISDIFSKFEPTILSMVKSIRACNDPTDANICVNDLDVLQDIIDAGYVDPENFDGYILCGNEPTVWSQGRMNLDELAQMCFDLTQKLPHSKVVFGNFATEEIDFNLMKYAYDKLANKVAEFLGKSVQDPEVGDYLNEHLPVAGYHPSYPIPEKRTVDENGNIIKIPYKNWRLSDKLAEIKALELYLSQTYNYHPSRWYTEVGSAKNTGAKDNFHYAVCALSKTGKVFIYTGNEEDSEPWLGLGNNRLNEYGRNLRDYMVFVCPFTPLEHVPDPIIDTFDWGYVQNNIGASTTADERATALKDQFQRLSPSSRVVITENREEFKRNNSAFRSP